MNSADTKTSPLLRTGAFNNINSTNNANYCNITADNGNLTSNKMAMTMSPNHTINDQDLLYSPDSSKIQAIQKQTVDTGAVIT